MKANTTRPLRLQLGIGAGVLGQLIRFGIVGVGVNLLLYMGYLAMVSAQVGVKTAMSIAYACGVAVGFVLNRHWSFRQKGNPRVEALSYSAVCLAGYLLNLAAMALLVDVLGYAHQAVQAVMVFVVAGFTFLLQRYWVFRSPGPGVQV